MGEGIDGGTGGGFGEACPMKSFVNINESFVAVPEKCLRSCKRLGEEVLLAELLAKTAREFGFDTTVAVACDDCRLLGCGADTHIYSYDGQPSPFKNNDGSAETSTRQADRAAEKHGYLPLGEASDFVGQPVAVRKRAATPQASYPLQTP